MLVCVLLRENNMEMIPVRSSYTPEGYLLDEHTGVSGGDENVLLYRPMHVV